MRLLPRFFLSIACASGALGVLSIARQSMNTKQDTKNPQLEEENDRWGTLVVIAFLIGPPVIGILYTIVG
ncbi:hypothetical protein [Aeoliella sp. SH292]|uniref:hypothetical protein n=1 Tax=Aeoliella sp. SH292 TaxID=3454464 RepID=UPI003F990092